MPSLSSSSSASASDTALPLPQHQQQLARCQSSRLLQCFRAIGMIVDELPIVWYAMGKESFATASLGKSFVVYKCDKLTPVLVSPQLPKKILALEVLAKKQLTFTACGRDILVWKRVKHTHTLTGHAGELKQLLAVGNVLFSMDDARTIRIWDLDTMELLNELSFPPEFTPSVMMHPATYLNKILVGSEEGALQLWNIRSMKCIYTFKGWASAVTSLTQSPAVDVVGVGLASGHVVLHHVQLDKRVVEFAQAQGRVTALSFRTDAGAQAPFVVSGTTTGDIAVWNLESKRLESVIAHAHDGPITSLVFLQNEPILLSTGTDNAIKMWIFDHLTGGTARLLKSREGHRAPPTRIRYYGSNTLATMGDGTTCQILSAGQDRAFRVFHTAREQQSTELSQGPLLKKAKKFDVRVDELKLPPITQFAAMETRERDWSNVVTCHESEPAAYVWRFEHRAIGTKVLRQFDPRVRVTPGSEDDLRRQQTAATCVAISTCGHFALVGSVGGAVFRYNMQSGEKRGSYPAAATPTPQVIRALVLPGSQVAAAGDSGDHSLAHRHDGPVSGVAVDALNAQVVSAGMDGKLKFWDFRNHALLYQLDVGSPISQIEVHRDSNLLAVASDDQVLRVFDVQTHKLVRRFHGHTHRLTDLQFSRDARWLFSSSADASLRVWDMPTAKCVDWVKFQKPVTGLAVSPTGEFLATTHVGHVGIYLWANRAFFSDVFLDSEPQAPVLLDMPMALNEVENEDALGVGSEQNPHVVIDHTGPEPSESGGDKTDTEGGAGSDVEPLDDALITLSTAPRAYWESLFHLELIKKRNKPIEPPKAPEKAPFFLQTMRKNDVQPTFVPIADMHKKESGEASSTAKAVSAGKTGEEDGAGSDEPMAGWGVGSDDEAWGDDGDDGEDEETVNNSGMAEPVAEGSRIMKSTGMVTTRCRLAALLVQAVEEEDNDAREDETTLSSEDHLHARRSRFSRVASYLQTLSASAVDVELNTLCMGDFDDEGKTLLGLFLQFLEDEMATRRHFQVLQAYLNRFLKLYEQLVVANVDLLARVESLCAVQQRQWDHLQQLLHNNLCLVQYFSKIQM